MSCNINLRTNTLVGADTGGTWTYLGYNATNPLGNPGTGGTTPPTLVGDNPLLNTETWVAGYYFFRYTIGSTCVAHTDTILNVAAKPIIGSLNNQQFCTLDSQVIDLDNYVSGLVGVRTWSVNSGSASVPSGSFDANNGTLDLSLVNNAGNYIFNLVVVSDTPSGFSDFGCIRCISTNTLTITINAPCQSGQDTTKSVSTPAGVVSLFNLLDGNKDASIVWTQLTGTTVAINNGYIGDVNFDSVTGCSFSFKAECGSSACITNHILTVNVQRNFGLNITKSSNVLTANHSSTNCGSPSYQWAFNNGSGWANIGTGSTFTITNQCSGQFRCTLNCSGCTQIATYDYAIDCNCNAPNFTFTQGATCLTMANSGSNCFTPLTDVLEYRTTTPSVGSWTVYPAGGICNCSWYKYLDVTAYCSVNGSNLRIGYSAIQSCGESVDRIYVDYGNGSTTTITGALNSYWEEYTTTQWVGTYGRWIRYKIRINTALGYIFKIVKFTYNGVSGSAPSCSDLSIQHENYPKIYYGIEGRRTVTYSCCPTKQITNTINPNGCLLFVQAIPVNLAGGQTGISANVTNCSSTPTYQWYKNGVLLSGETNQIVNTTANGLGWYEVVVSCGSCNASDDVNIVGGCSLGVTVTLTGGTSLTATVSGCSGSPSFQWQKEVSTGTWTNVGTNSNVYTPTSSGNYRVVVTCSGCTATGYYYDFVFNCSLTATITQSGANGQNLSATTTGCSGSVIYQWQWYNGTSWANVGTNSSTYTATNSGNYRVYVTCSANNCTAYSNVLIVNLCAFTVVASEIAGNQLTATPAGCSGLVMYKWYYYNGTSWVQVGISQTYSPTIAGSYKVIADCNNGCSDEDIITWCGFTVSIGQSGSTLTANISGCASPTILWEYSGNGGASWSYFGNTTVVTATQNGIYRVTITCSSCVKSAQITYNGACTTGVSLSYTAPTITATVTGCSGTINVVQWQYSATGTGWQIITGANSLTYNAVTGGYGSGFYRIIVNCNGSCPTSDEIQITVTCTGSVNITSANTSCTFDVPQTGNQVSILSVAKVPNTYTFTYNHQLAVTNTCGANNPNCTGSQTQQYITRNGHVIPITGSSRLGVGGYITNLRVKSYCNGVFHTLNMNLSSVVHGGNIYSFMTALKNEIQAQLNNWNVPVCGFPSISNYFVNVSLNTTTNIMSVELNNKDVSTGLWIGIDRLDNNLAYTTPSIFTGNAAFNQVQFFSCNAATCNTGCGNLIQYYKVENVVDLANSNFYSLTLNPVALMVITPVVQCDGVSVITKTCLKYTLTATVTGCSGTIVWKWEYRPTAGSGAWTTLPLDTAIIDVFSTGEYMATATCNSCNFSNTITI